MENLSQKEEIKAKAADYLDIVRSFSELLREENDALEKFETDKVAALYEQKVKLVTAYRSFVAFFIKNQEGLKLLDQEDKLTLREEALKPDDYGFHCQSGQKPYQGMLNFVRKPGQVFAAGQQ